VAELSEHTNLPESSRQDARARRNRFRTFVFAASVLVLLAFLLFSCRPGSLIASPRAVRYDAVDVGGSVHRDVIISRTGAGWLSTLRILRVEIAGDPAFRAEGASTSWRFRGNGSQSLSVSFSPIGPANYEAAMLVHHNGGASPLEVDLIGAGVLPNDVAVEPSSLDLSIPGCASTVQTSLKVRTDAATSLAVRSVSLAVRQPTSGTMPLEAEFDASSEQVRDMRISVPVFPTMLTAGELRLDLEGPHELSIVVPLTATRTRTDCAQFFFDTNEYRTVDSTTSGADVEARISELRAFLKIATSETTVSPVLVGSADERFTPRYNLCLSARRACWLYDQLGVDTLTITPIGETKATIATETVSPEEKISLWAADRWARVDWRENSASLNGISDLQPTNQLQVAPLQCQALADLSCDAIK
jgi:hypothetical protein